MVAFFNAQSGTWICELLYRCRNKKTTEQYSVALAFFSQQIIL